MAIPMWWFATAICKCGTIRLLFISLPTSAGFQGIARQDQAGLAHMRKVIGSLFFCSTKKFPILPGLDSLTSSTYKSFKTWDQSRHRAYFQKRTEHPHYTLFCSHHCSKFRFQCCAPRLQQSTLAANPGSTRTNRQNLLLATQNRENDPVLPISPASHHDTSKWMTANTPSSLPGPRLAGFPRTASLVA